MACWTKNKRRNYFRIFDINTDYPLDLCEEFKLMHHLTWDELAETLVKQHDADQLDIVEVIEEQRQ